MEKTNQAKAAKIYLLIQDFFDQHGIEAVKEGMETMAVEYLASEAHREQERLQRAENALLVFGLQKLIRKLYKMQKP